jgi:histidinol dehydrogenase
MRILEGPAAERYVRKLEQRGHKLDAFEPQVRRIVNDVRQNGDRALRKYAERWDGLQSGDSLQVDESEMKSALKACGPDLRDALEKSAASIRNFCEWQKPAEWKRTKQGRTLAQIVRPLGSADATFRAGAIRCHQHC